MQTLHTIALCWLCGVIGCLIGLFVFAIASIRSTRCCRHCGCPIRQRFTTYLFIEDVMDNTLNIPTPQLAVWAILNADGTPGTNPDGSPAVWDPTPGFALSDTSIATLGVQDLGNIQVQPVAVGSCTLTAVGKIGGVDYTQTALVTVTQTAADFKTDIQWRPITP